MALAFTERHRLIEQMRAQKQAHAYMINWIQRKVSRTHNGQSIVSPTNGMEKNWISTSKKIKMNLYFIAYIKINSKWIEDLTVWSEIVRLPKENTEVSWQLSRQWFLRYDSKNTDPCLTSLLWLHRRYTKQLTVCREKIKQITSNYKPSFKGHRLSLGDKKVEFLQLFSNGVIWSSASSGIVGQSLF